MSLVSSLLPQLPQSAGERANKSVFVGNIPYEATEENLKDIFSQVGPVVSFRLVYDRETGKPKGYGFCEYQDLETAQSAMRNLNNYDFHGRPLRVGVAAGESTKDDIRGMQQALGGPIVESPFGDDVEPGKAPEAISKAVASLPPEQMYELMKQMKVCVQNNPNEARNMLLQNPQLAYALLQAQIVMKIVDPQVALAMLYRQTEQIPPLLPSGEGEQKRLPGDLEQRMGGPPAGFNMPPSGPPTSMNSSIGENVMRTFPIDVGGMGGPRPNMGGPGPNMGGPNMGGPGPNMGGPGPNMGGPGPNMGGPGPNMGGPGPNMGGPRPNMGGPGPNMGGPGPNMGGPGPNMGGPGPNMGGPGPHMGGPGPNMGGPGPNMGRPGMDMGRNDLRGPSPDMHGGPRPDMHGPDMRGPDNRGPMGDHRGPMGDPRGPMNDRFRGDMGGRGPPPREMGGPGGPQMRPSRPDMRDPRDHMDPRDNRDPRGDSRDPRRAPDPRMDPRGGMNPTRSPMGQPGASPGAIRPGAPPPGGPAEGQDNEKAALIMQVLQLTDQQIAMLPADQRQSILVLKEQIARSGGPPR